MAARESFAARSLQTVGQLGSRITALLSIGSTPSTPPTACWPIALPISKMVGPTSLSGLILCEIAAMLLRCPRFPGVINEPVSEDEKLQNMELAMSKLVTSGIDVPQYLRARSSSDFQEVGIFLTSQSEDCLYDLLAFLKFQYENQT